MLHRRKDSGKLPGVGSEAPNWISDGVCLKTNSLESAEISTKNDG